MRRIQPEGLWQHSDFFRFWSAHTISAFGSLITREGLPLAAVITLGASGSEMALLGIASAAPVILVGLFAGVWVDRLPRRPILIAADLGRALLLVAIPVLAVTGQLRIWHLYVVAALAGVLTVFFQVADQSYLPSLVGRDKVVEGNSKLGVSSSLAEVGGPPLAGVLVQLITAPFAILFDALSFVLSALFVWLIRTPEPRPTPHEERQRLLPSVAEGIRVITGNPLLRALTAATATSGFFGGFYGSLYAIFALRDLHLTPGLLGVVVGAGGVGSLVGAIFAVRVTRRFETGRTLILTMGIPSIVGLLTPLAGGPVLIATLFLIIPQLLGDMLDTIYEINEVSLRQSLTPDHLLGRANASRHVIVGGMHSVGLVVGGVLGDTIGTRPTIFIAVLGGLAATLWLVFSPLWNIREVKW